MSERKIPMPLVTWPWERWFAWHPVKTMDGKKVWLRWIERRHVWFVFDFYEYREIA